MNKKNVIGSAAVATLVGLAFAATSFAATPTAGAPMWGGQPGGMHGQMPGGRMGGMGAIKPAVVGQVASVNGTTLTVTSRGFGKNATTTTTYTVDASNATVLKNNATSSVSAIAVGDSVFAQGTLTGTNLVATKIFDGKLGMGMGRGGANMQHATSTPAFTGNGEPVVAGKVASVNGSTLTVTNSGNATYTVDVSSAKVQKMGVTNPTVSNISVGDSVIIQGAINGTSVTATTVIDQTSTNSKGGPMGFLGSIGSFFKHLFGF